MQRWWLIDMKRIVDSHVYPFQPLLNHEPENSHTRGDMMYTSMVYINLQLTIRLSLSVNVSYILVLVWYTITAHCCHLWWRCSCCSLSPYSSLHYCYDTLLLPSLVLLVAFCSSSSCYSYSRICCRFCVLSWILRWKSSCLFGAQSNSSGMWRCIVVIRILAR